MVVEHAQVHGLIPVDVSGRGVVAEHRHLCALQRHHPEVLRTASIIADAHADSHHWRLEHFEAGIAHLEVAQFKMLEWRFGLVVSMVWDLRLAGLADDPTCLVDKHRGVEAAALWCELGVAETEADAKLAGQVDEAAGCQFYGRTE